MTVDAVAEGLGLSARHTYRLLDGTIPLKRAYVIALAHLFGQPVAAVQRAAGESRGEA